MITIKLKNIGTGGSIAQAMAVSEFIKEIAKTDPDIRIEIDCIPPVDHGKNERVNLFDLPKQGYAVIKTGDQQPAPGVYEAKKLSKSKVQY